MELKRETQKCPACTSSETFDPAREIGYVKGSKIHKMKCSNCNHVLRYSEK